MNLDKLKNRLQKRLKLQHWKIKYEEVNQERINEIMNTNNIHGGCAYSDYTFLTADIYILDNHENKEKVLIHEMLHVLLNDLNINIKKKKEERLIETLSDLIYKEGKKNE